MADLGFCRISDTGMGQCLHASHAPTIPFPYITVFSAGSVDTITNDLGTIFIGSPGLSTCGHPTVALVGSTTVIVNDLGLHRLSDTGANFGPYVANVSSVDTLTL